MTAIFARYLPDFSAETSAAAEAEPLAVLLRSARRSAEPPPPPPPAEDREALLREAEERGRRLGRAQAAAETAAALDAALAESQAVADAQMRESRRAWAEEEGQVLAAALIRATGEIEARLAARLAHLLLPVLGEAVRARAVAELRDAIARLLADAAKPAVRVSGPQDLLDALAAALGPQAQGIAFAPAQGADVTVTAEDAVIESQLAAWTGLLSAAVTEA
ncbi:conserved hypothetical protein [Methylobacterium sp. 4-46]|uniref:hypothetical protein n=1 Tax=unclassified Methylobacterium TaxID=2615210 RepID=UPI000152BEC9|nr:MULTISPECIES: hypothetical protein [Methylobacterium]ACA17630.1 conserved hypothetical protein [Methylobacterium sp. 4-46]WFT83302.1 hypothetical protein QA634_16345 [Methylobacterium nodulans]